jgi:uncharacterized RDD family membrane protein YckC
MMISPRLFAHRDAANELGLETFSAHHPADPSSSTAIWRKQVGRGEASQKRCLGMPMTYVPPTGFDPYAPPKTEGEAIIAEIVPPIEFAGYAGFWRRFGAGLIDGVVMGLIFVLIGLVSGVGFAFTGGMVLAMLSRFGMIAQDDEPPPPGGGDVWISLGVGAVIGIAACIVYHARMESSASQATIGKKALGLRVTDLDGRHISFRRALRRCAAKIVSCLTLSIGFLMAARTEKRQALHDIIAGTLVMKVR